MPTQSPYQLDPEQILRASKALLEHLRNETQRVKAASATRSLLEEGVSSEDEGEEGSHTPIWLNLTTKQHIADRNRLKPSRIPVPHSLNTNPDLSICLITADPQRAVKNAVADAAFPKALSSRINRIIGITKLKTRYKTFESRRQLLSESDIFLADDRIINRLPDALGKTFYKGTSKRPIAINIANVQRKDGKRVKSGKDGKESQNQDLPTVAAPSIVAKEITRAIDSTPVSLRPGTSVAVRVGLASFDAQDLVDNVEAVTTRLIDRHVVKGWKNVKSIHIKSPTSTAIPIWNSDQLWTEEADIDEDLEVDADDQEQGVKRKRSQGTKRGPQLGQRKRVKLGDAQTDSQNGLDEVDAERRKKLASQKTKMFGSTAMAL